MNTPSFLRRLSPAVFVALCAFAPAVLADEANYTHQADVIYGRKYGMALTMEVFKPKEHANGIGIISVLSGGWYSNHPDDPAKVRQPILLERGYTVFAVNHGSQPKFSIPEIVEDMNRAVRFIRFHAAEYGIDPARIGITGGSAGGHLSLMQGMAGGDGKPDAKDPIDRLSSRVQAVACFFPPTDFLNYGKPGEIAVGRGVLWNFSGAFGFTDYDPYWRRLVPITDDAKILEIGRQISPITHISAGAPPTLIAHGDKDWLVPMQQSETFIAKLKAAGVDAKLVVKPDAEHGWATMGDEQKQFADWFDAHLKKPVAAP
ncbi:MAG TPA: alpha/beta hydrolase [Chthoniobacteraceae bacterium]|jgi:acetyl esterase/lipase|nr:alpha/beta hydrolase [Chthoniobacteraceae bacterium]